MKQDVRIVDVRHEQTATFAAEGMAKLTRRPGVAVLTAGPGVTNGISAVTTAHFNGSPLVVLGGRAPAGPVGRRLAAGVRPRAGAGADHQDGPTITDPDDDRGGHRRRWPSWPLAPHRGPVFVDFPLDVVFADGDGADAGRQGRPRPREVDPDELDRVGALIAAAERPALIAGCDVYWGGAWEELRAAVEAPAACRRS